MVTSRTSAIIKQRTCVWNIEAPEVLGKKPIITLTFELRSVECNWDFVLVFDGVGIDTQSGIFVGEFFACVFFPTLFFTQHLPLFNTAAVLMNDYINFFEAVVEKY